MKVILFRHLPTQNNLNNKFIGRLDLDCDGEYIDKHLPEIEEKMNFLSFTQLFCSPLKRARHSASIYFPNSSYVIDRRLVERDLGRWKNISKQIVREQFPSAFFANGNLDFNYTPPNGEAFSCVLKRVSSFFLDINDNFCHDDEIGVVTHNGIITAVKCLINSTSSTENIEFQPFLTAYEIEITPNFIKNLHLCFESYSED